MKSCGTREPFRPGAVSLYMGTMNFDKRHGGPFDRGAADSWYSRGRNPHYFKGGSYMSERVDEAQMTAEEIAAYHAGFNYNEADPSARKEWD